MKRILIAMHYLEIGGAESSLIGLLEALDPNRVEVDLFLYRHEGLYMSAIPNWVHVLPEMPAYASLECPMTEAVKKGQFGMVLGRLWAKWRYKRYQKTLTADEREKDISVFPLVTDSCMRFLPSLDGLGEYDLAISYLQPHNIVRQKVRAKKYLAWIHTDYSTVHVNHDWEVRIWGAYDYINSISKECTKAFLTTFPELKEKIIEIENILPARLIKERSGMELRNLETQKLRKDGVLTLCSVGRITYAKNYDNIPYMAKKLRELCNENEDENENSLTANRSTLTDFRWYIVGPGEHESIDKLSEKLGVKENVIFLGPSDNPYPYIKNCDIYVHPSRYEGKSIVVREAQVLQKPVIITNYPTAHSQVNDGVDGIICEQTNEGVAKAIFDLANDKEKQNKIIDYLQSHDMSGQNEVEKIYGLIG